MTTIFIELWVSDGNTVVEFTKKVEVDFVPREGECLWIVTETEDIADVFKVDRVSYRFDYPGTPILVLCDECDDESDFVLLDENRAVLLSTGWIEADFFTAFASGDIA